MSTGPMDCNELVELVTAYLDESLDPKTRARFDLHLLECDGCQNYLQQFRATVSTVGKIRDEQLDPIFRARLLDTFGIGANSLPPNCRGDRLPRRRLDGQTPARTLVKLADFRRSGRAVVSPRGAATPPAVPVVPFDHPRSRRTKSTT